MHMYNISDCKIVIYLIVDVEGGGKKVLLKSFWENDFIKYSYHIGFRKNCSN